MLHLCACGTHVLSGSTCPACGRTPSSTLTRTAVAALMGLSLGACEEGEVQAKYGIAVIDDDGDGYDSGVDCDDSNANIHPDAEETAGDGVDSDCDGEDDPSDSGA